MAVDIARLGNCIPSAGDSYHFLLIYKVALRPVSKEASTIPGPLVVKAEMACYAMFLFPVA